MDKLGWLELVEQAEELDVALLNGDVQTLVDVATNLIETIRFYAGRDAEAGGWYEELENFVDTMTFPN